VLELEFNRISLAQVLIAVGIGLTFVIYVAWTQRPQSWKISTFFLGGRTTGAPLSAQVYWGSSFSFANGLIYFSALGYLYGLSVIWFQVPWILGVWFLAWRCPQLIEITDKFTLHGFLGSRFGPLARIIASVVTITGFMGIFAYEVAISTETIAGVLGIKTGVPILVLLVGTYVAAHADVGGFAGTARTDRVQNMFGMISVVVILYFLVAFPTSAVNRANLDLSKLGESLINVSSVPWQVWLGIVCFAPFLNIVDMSHWQTIAANTLVSKREVTALQWAIFRSGWWMIFLPAAAGAFIGYVWRGVEGTTDANVFAATLAGTPGASGDLAGLVAGFIVLGLLAAGFSCAAGYLLSSIQTLSWDLRHYILILSSDEKELTNSQQHRIVAEARVWLYGVAIASLVIFLSLRAALGDEKILPFQFLLAGILVSLAPATLYALWLQNKKRIASEAAAKFVVLGIVVGYLFGIGVYLRPLLLSNGSVNEVFQWSPILSFSFSFLITVCAIALDRQDAEPVLGDNKTAEKTAVTPAAVAEVGTTSAGGV
jgi:Na+/proline symporter